MEELFLTILIWLISGFGIIVPVFVWVLLPKPDQPQWISRMKKCVGIALIIFFILFIALSFAVCRPFAEGSATRDGEAGHAIRIHSNGYILDLQFESSDEEP